MSELSRIIYAQEPNLGVFEFRRLLVESGLGKIRPIGDEPRLEKMLSSADVIMTARLDQPGRPLVGVARCITDFAWCCYLSDLAVAPAAQGLGIGKGLLDELRWQLGPGVSLILSSVPEVVGFYEKVGMTRVDHAFWYKREF